jgi:hypothetical protein
MDDHNTFDEENKHKHLTINRQVLYFRDEKMFANNLKVKNRCTLKISILPPIPN